MASIVNLELTKGDLETIPGTVLDQDGNPVDIQNVLLQWGVKKYETDTDYAIFLDGGNNPAVGGVTILDDGTTPLKGKYQIAVAPSDTAALTSGYYVHALRVINGPADSHTAVQGTCLIQEDIVDGG